MPLTDNHTQGAFQISRSLFTSDIWEMSPDYLKLFIYIIGKANHQTKRYRGFQVERGQYFCHSGELQEQLCYYVGYRRECANKSKVKNIMKYLRDTGRIVTEKKPRGMLITVLNYDKYQTLANYEKTNEGNQDKYKVSPKKNQLLPSINKNEKELKNKNTPMCDKKLFNWIKKFNSIASPEGWMGWCRRTYSAKVIDRAWNKATRGSSNITTPATFVRCLNELKRKENENNS